MSRKLVFALLALVAIVFAIGPLALGCGQVDVTPGPDPDCPIAAPPEEPTPSANVYGARLAPFRRVFDDGTQIVDPARFWDSERSEACAFVRVEDGPGRCLPAFVWHSKPGNFADAACTQEVAIVDACAELPRYVRDTTSQPWQTCEPRPLAALLPLGDPLLVGAQLYRVVDGECVAQSNVDASNAAMPLGEPIPLDAFVTGEEGP